MVFHDPVAETSEGILDAFVSQLLILLHQLG